MVALSCLLLAGAADATRPNTPFHPCHGQNYTAKAFERFAERTWRLSRWERQKPKVVTIVAAHHRIHCAAGPGHRKAMKHDWRVDQRAFYEHRSAMLWRERVTPYPGTDGKWYATPYIIPLCESGADPHIGYAGLYGLISPTWAAYGGLAFAPTAGAASKHEQDVVAARLWAVAGESAWKPYEASCAYR